MTISLTNAGKRFNREWIFRNFSYQFSSGRSYAITGPNGSGKSTLLQTIGGAMNLSEGSLRYETTDGNSPADPSVEWLFRHISIAAPYLDLVEEMTLLEFLQFHAHFKPFVPGISTNEMAAAVQLESAKHKQIRYFSSGMKQRVKLIQAIFSNVPCVLLDEPCTNLDAPGMAIYHRLIEAYCPQRLVIVCSNDPAEYDFCQEVLQISDWKKPVSPR